MHEHALVMSRYLTIVDVEPEWSFLSHAVFGNRRVYDRPLAEIVRIFATPRSSAQAYAMALRDALLIPSTPDGQHFFEIFVAELLEACFLIRAGEDEDGAVAERLRSTWGRDIDRAFGHDAIEDAYTPALGSRLAERLAQPAALEPVSFLLLGWCFTQTVRPVLVEEARARGLAATVHTGFQDDLHLIAQLAPEVVVLQLSHRQLLAPLLDGFHRMPLPDLETRLDAACAAIRHSIGRALEHCSDSLLLVQGIAAPQTSPLGALDVRHPIGFFEAVATLNRTARQAVAAHPRALFVDEDVLLASHGKRHLLDDLVSTYSHHGALAFEAGVSEGPSRQTSFGLGDRMLLHRLLAGAYLDLYELSRGRGAIRCVAVDLDGTLWPGLIGEDDFRFNSDRLVVPLMYGRYGGLHEALRILRDRGILLAVVSKNNLAEVLERWSRENLPLALGVQPEETGHYLGPEDFVRLQVGWDPKSVQLRRLAGDLGITLDQIAFVDDNPVEREEVRQALPEVLILGEDMNRVREFLLTSPRFQTLEPSQEARHRTETTRARLARDEARKGVTDHAAFLASLAVRCRVCREQDTTRVGRIAELLGRTNQFNTNPRRLGTAELERLIGHTPDADVLTLEVADRFADYGLVGVALLLGPELSCFALSCRVIGLEVERVLLRRVLEIGRGRGPELNVPFLPTERNLPATRLFLTPGFELGPGGEGYRFDFGRSSLPPFPAHCAVTEV